MIACLQMLAFSRKVAWRTVCGRVCVCSAVLYFEVTLYTGPLVDDMLLSSDTPLAVAFAKTLVLVVAATVLLVGSAFWVRFTRIRSRSSRYHA